MRVIGFIFFTAVVVALVPLAGWALWVALCLVSLTLGTMLR